ncbi:hypothetical protein [Sphingobacterium chuzhouense]|uniref:Fimbrillin-A associated anchor proteins Mfa1 and Mfa2 n=1 Tax=Sphingobacterium chuzhouense TaxID=1742264 RepID=A0ABR7XNC2_9SPHI|nr:hypothetical protein [Sphingobacterium chuzhouense]MBD1420674.1 hypothetical protein [Sphingobacterium chuzhouense]
MKHNYIKALVACFIAVAVFASSCQKENGVDNLGGEATVTINMQGVGPSTGNKAKAGLRASASAGNTVATPAVQRQVVKFNNQFNVKATLREVTPASSTPALRASANRAETTATGAGDILPLADGTEYTVVISQGGEVVTTETFTQGDSEHKFNIEAGSYTYVAYAYGDADASGADRDPLWVSGSLNVTAGENNTLSIVLEHKLTEVTVVFDAGAGRTINAIGAGTLAPNHSYEFNEQTGVVTFGGATTAAAISFTGQTPGQIWTSNPTMIAVEDTDNGVVELSNVTINNTPGSITSDGWALRAGVQYRLELNLGDKEEEGIEIGGSVWSPGNLTYDPSTDEYGFSDANNQPGDYWFAGYTKPKVLPDPSNSNQNPSLGTNGPLGDPCALAGSWRLPTRAEMAELQTNTNAGGADNPGTPQSWAVARWVDTFTPSTGNTLGMFFGTQVHPGVANRDNYLFLLFGGSYNDNNVLSALNTKGYYLITDPSQTSGYNFLDIGGQKESLGWDMSFTYNANHAVQIRCVQN